MNEAPKIANCVCVVLRSHDGCYYVSERNNTKDQQGVLAFPGGDGTPGEQPRKDATRELQEETTLAVQDSRLKFVDRLGPFPRTTPNGPAFYYTHIFSLQLDAQELPQHAEPHKMGPWQKLPPTQILAMPPTAFLPGTQHGVKHTESLVHFQEKQSKSREAAAPSH
jgi:ADP-ribose pyrophosphatase YjhB (NUDIX family)